jgi:hypothetical protein
MGSRAAALRAGTTVLSVDETYAIQWTMPIPAYPTTCGCDLVFDLTGMDKATMVEQTDSCTVTTTCD